jgi:uncharacterized protein YutE (UPF0331/DUF86 family)
VELAVKAALVEKNVSIYEKNNRTLNTHDALQQLAKVWGIERIDGQSRLELLLDERNAIQHRYGAVDDITLDYHMQTAFDILKEILTREFDTDLGDWIRDNLDKQVWARVRFVAEEDEAEQVPSDAIIEKRSATLDLVDGFSRYERNVRQIFSEVSGKSEFIGSTLDVVLKTLSNAHSSASLKKLIKDVPSAYKLRNRVIHGAADAEASDVKRALEILDKVVESLRSVPPDLLKKSLRANQVGLRGTRLPEELPPAGTPSDSADSDNQSNANESSTPESLP